MIRLLHLFFTCAGATRIGDNEAENLAMPRGASCLQWRSRQPMGSATPLVTSKLR